MTGRVHRGGADSDVLNGFIPHLRKGDQLPLQHLNAIEEALGLTPSAEFVTGRPFWDPIAHATGLPDVDQLKHGVDGPGTHVLPAAIWNRAVDIANARSRA